MTIGVQRLRAGSTGVRLELARYLPAAILAAYGIFITSLYLRGIMTLYINPAYVPPTTLAGVVLLGLSVVAFLHPPSVTCTCAECVDGSCECDHTSPRIWPYAVLSIPLLIALAFPPHGLAAGSAQQRGLQIAGLTTVSNSSTLHRVSLSVDTRSFTMQDWVGALSADPNPRDYAGKPVTVSGMVLHSPGSVPPGYIMVIRYQVTCCIADARPVGLVVKDTSHGALKDNQWVSVTGTMGAANDGGQQIAVVDPRTMTPIKSQNPYMY
jgi:uncharacterized repeat protein (TIGR03943 family)